MPRYCTICNSKDRAQIDADLVRGDSTYRIAERYGVSASAVQRHSKRHLSPALATMRTQQQAEAQASLLARVERIIARAEAMFAKVSEEGRTTQALDVLKELRLQLELYGKATGELDTRPQVTVNLMTSPEWLEIRAVIFAALAAYPDARAALSGRLLELEAKES